MTENPYESPVYYQAQLADPDEVTFPPCPNCNSSDVEPTPYSAWYGRRAPTAIEDLTCSHCQCNFNGLNGSIYPPKKNPMIWFLVGLAGFILYIILVVWVELSGF